MILLGGAGREAFIASLREYSLEWAKACDGLYVDGDCYLVRSIQISSMILTRNHRQLRFALS